MIVKVKNFRGERMSENYISEVEIGVVKGDRGCLVRVNGEEGLILEINGKRIKI